MFRRVASVFSVALIVTAAQLAAAQPEPALPALTAADLERLEAGEIVVNIAEGHDLPTGDAYALIAASPERLLEVIREPESETDTTESEILRVEGEYTYVYMEIDTPWPMDDREFVLRQRHGSRDFAGTRALWLDWDYVEESGNLVDTEGYWLLVPHGSDGQHTLVRYNIFVDLGGMVPDFVMSWAIENALPATIRGVASQAEVARGPMRSPSGERHAEAR